MSMTGEAEAGSAGEQPVDAATFAYALPPLINASGIDGNGNPAFVEVSTPLGAMMVPITIGDSTTDIISAMITALPLGLDVQRTGDTSFLFTEIGPDTFASFQTADNNLAEFVEAQVVPEPASLWLLAVGCLAVFAIGGHQMRPIRHLPTVIRVTNTVDDKLL